MRSIPPPRSDAVVVIRPFTPDDVTAYLAGEDDEIRAWFHAPEPSTPDAVSAWIARAAAAFASGGPRRTFAVVDVGSGALCGHVEGNHLGGGVANLSYSVHPWARGRGIATRAVRLCMDDMVEALAVDRFVIRVEPGNPASAGVARRAGFEEAGTHVEDGRLHRSFELDALA